MPALRVLLTAFGSFPGAPVNPTMAIARRVERRHGRACAPCEAAQGGRSARRHFLAVSTPLA
jgi:hypothetical protein